MSATHILLVEGEADRGLHQALCKEWGVAAQVTVSTPRDAGHRHNTKQAVLSVLPQYLKQLDDGQIRRLGVVLDADSVSHGGGFQNTLAALSQVFQAHGYSLSTHGTGHAHTPNPPPTGLLFVHHDGLPDVGAWVMPNNADDGMVEDWLTGCIHPQEAPLLAHAQTAMDGIPGGAKFKPLHQPKAEVATWLAWQAKPGHGLYHAVEARLLNERSPQWLAFESWLRRVFPS